MDQRDGRPGSAELNNTGAGDGVANSSNRGTGPAAGRAGGSLQFTLGNAAESSGGVRRRVKPAVERLEDRMMMSVSQAADAAAGVFSRGIATVAAAKPEASPVRQLIAVDSSLADAGITKGLGGDGVLIITLNRQQDALDQVSEALRPLSGVQAIHLLTHGTPGALEVGAGVIDRAALKAKAAELSEWAQSLAPHATIHLYGCDVAAGSAGKSFVKALAKRTRAAVAASIDDTGAERLGGDWNLEYVAGGKRANVQPISVGSFDGLLATVTVAASAGTTTHVAGMGDTAVDAAVTISSTDGSQTISSATAQITTGYVSGEDLLDLPSPPGGFSSSFDAGTGTLTVTSTTPQTLATFQSVMRTVVYRNQQSPYATLGARGVVFTAASTSTSAKSLAVDLPVDSIIRQRIIDTLHVVDQIGQKIAGFSGHPFQNDTTQLPLVNERLTDLLYPNSRDLDASGNAVPDLTKWATPQSIGQYLQLESTASTYFGSAGTITDLSGLQSALAAKLTTVVPGLLATKSVTATFTKPTSTDARRIDLAFTIANTYGTDKALVIDMLQRDLALAFPGTPLVSYGGGADIQFSIGIDLAGHEYGTANDPIAANKATIAFQKLNAFAGYQFSGMNTSVAIGAIGGTLTDASGKVGVSMPVDFSGATSRTLDNWATDGSNVTGFTTKTGAATITLPISASIGGVSATTANTKIVLTDSDLFDSTPAAYTVTDFDKLQYFAGISADDIVSEVLKVGDLFESLDKSDASLLGVRTPFLKDETIGKLLKLKDLFDSAIGSQIDVSQPVLNTNGRDELSDYRLPLSSDSSPKFSVYSDLRGHFQFGVVLNKQWPVHTIDVAADSSRKSLDDLVTDLNAAFTTANVAIVASNVDDKLTFKASSLSVTNFALVPVQPTGDEAGVLSPGTSAVNSLANNTPTYITVTGTTTGSVTGTNYYTIGSPLGAAAVHAGLLAAGQTGVVRVTRMNLGFPILASQRNGVTSSGSGGNAGDSYLLESADADLRRLGVVDPTQSLTVLEAVGGGAVKATMPLQADLSGAAKIVIKNGSTSYTVSVADNARTSLTDTLADINAALATAGIAATDLTGQLVDATGNVLSGAPVSGTDYYLQLYTPDGSTWTDYTLSPETDPTAYKVLPLGFLSGDVAAAARPDGLRTFQDFTNSSIFPGLTISPVYDATNGKVTLEFSASGTTTPTEKAAFDFALHELSKLTTTSTTLTFSPTVSSHIAFGLEFKIGPTTPITIAGASALPADGLLASDAHLTLDYTLQDRYSVTVPSSWTTANTSPQNLISDVNRALKQATNSSNATVDLTNGKLIARQGLGASQMELVTAQQANSGTAITLPHSSGVLSADAEVAFTYNGTDYVMPVKASATTANTGLGDLIQDLNDAISQAVVDADNDGHVDSSESVATNLSDLFFTTIGQSSGADKIYLFTTSGDGATWPTSITLTATSTDTAVTKLKFDDGAGATTSSISAQASGTRAILRNPGDGSALAGGSVSLTMSSFDGSIYYGFNKLDYASVSGGISASARVDLASGVTGTASDVANAMNDYLTQTLADASGSGDPNASLTLTDLTAASGATIDPAATIQISIPDIANDTAIVATPLGVAIPIPEADTGGKLSTDASVNFLYQGARYTISVAASATTSNTSFANLATQFNAALADATRTVGSTATAHYDASAVFTATATDDGLLQINVLTPTANPDYTTISFLPGLSAFGEVGQQGAFGPGTVADSLQDILPALDNLQANNGMFSTFKLPLINTTVADLVNIKGDLLNRIGTFREASVSGVDQIAAALAGAMSLPADHVRVTFDSNNNAYRVDVQYETGAAASKPIDMTLADFYKFTGGEVPQGLERLADVGSNSPLTVKVKATLNLSIGIDLTDPQHPRTFLYAHDNTSTFGLENGTAVRVSVEASADDIEFTAALGAFGVFVRGGSASLAGPVTEHGQDPVNTFDEDTHELHFVTDSDAAVLTAVLAGDDDKYYVDPGTGEGDASDDANFDVSFAGSVEANLPLFTPTEFTNPFTNRTVNAYIQSEGSEDVHPGGNIFNLRIADLGAFAEESLQLTELQNQIAGIYSTAGGTLSGPQQTQVDGLQSQVNNLADGETVEIFTPDVDDENSGIQAPTILDLFRDPAILVDGIDTLLGTVETGLRGLDSLDIPLIGDALGSAVKDVFNFRRGWLLDMKHQLRGQGEAVFESLKAEIYNFLGPDGANLLLKDNGVRSVDGMIRADSADDVTLDFLDENGEPLTGLGGFGAHAVQFKVRLGQVLVNTGADIGFNFDSLKPALSLGIDGGVTFKLGWDMTIGFGVSLEDGFYIVTDSDPSANEAELRFEAGLSGADTTYTVAERSASPTGYSIKDKDGNWVLGPAKGDGSRDILNLVPVDEDGEIVTITDFEAAAPSTDPCDDPAPGEAPPVKPYWVVAAEDSHGDWVPAYIDKLGQYRAQEGSRWTSFNGGDSDVNPDEMVQYNQTAPFSAYGSLFAFNLTAVDQIQKGLSPKGDADYFWDPEAASTITSYGRNDADNGVNRNNKLRTRVSGRIGINLEDPSAASGDYLSRPGPTATGFMLMDGSEPITGGQPVLDDQGQFIPVKLISGEWFVVEPQADSHGVISYVPDHPITEDETENRITFQELSEAGLSIIQLKLDAQVVLNLSLVLKVSDNANIPKITADLNVDWKKEFTFTAGEEEGGGEADAGGGAEEEGKPEPSDFIPEVGVNNIRLDLGSFLTKFIKPIAGKIDGALKPLDPIINVLKTKIPVLSDMAGRDIKLTTLLTTFGGPYGQAVGTTIDIAILVRELSGLMAAVPDDANVYLPIGNFWLAKIGAGPFGQPGVGTQIYYDNSEVTPPSVTQRNQSLIADPGAGANAVNNALGGLDALDANTSSQPGVKQEDRGGFQLPILQDPMTIFRLMMGQDVPLVTFKLPDLDFNFDKQIPLVRIVCFEVGLRLGLQVHGQLAMGYDTLGLRMFKDSGDPGDLVQGFYISDRANADGTGADVDEFSVSATIALYGGINVVLAKAGIEGGLTFKGAVNLNDPNNDGKLRVTEAIDLVAQTGNPLDLADISMSGEVYARYYYWVGVDVGFFTITLYRGGKTFARAKLFELKRDGSDGPPIPAELVTTVDEAGTSYANTLMINMGPNAEKRVSNQDPLNVKDGAERMRIWNDSGSTSTVKVQYLNYSSTYTKTYTGVTRIVAFGGEGDDTIDASGLNGLPVEFDGGAGNDTILLASGAAAAASILKGGAGDDTITMTAAGVARIEGGDGNDTLTGGSGATADITLDGGRGADAITGGAGGGKNRVLLSRAFGKDTLSLQSAAGGNIVDLTDASLPVTADLITGTSTVKSGDTNSATFNLANVTEIRGSSGADTFNLKDPTTRTGSAGRGLVLRGGDGNDIYNITADDLSHVSTDGVTIDDGNYPTTAATASVETGDLDTDCGHIDNITVTDGGSGYLIAPEVVITDETGGGARAVASIDKNGTVTGIYMLDGGENYTHPTVMLVTPHSTGDKLNFSSTTTGNVTLDSLADAGAPDDSQDYRLSLGGRAIKFVGWDSPGDVRPVDYGVSEMDSVNITLPTGTLTQDDDLDLTDTLTVTAKRMVQNAAITADTVRITTEHGFSADHPIQTTNNGDLTIRTTGKNLNSYTAAIATARATVSHGTVTSIAITSGGDYYDFAPVVTVEDDHGNFARAVATVSNGHVTGITVLDGGTGYLSTPAPKVVIAPPASVKLNDYLSTSTVNSDPGTGDGRGKVTLRSELGSIDQSGDVMFPSGSHIEWEDGDFHYTQLDTLDDITPTRYASTAGGSGATAVAVLDGDGRVTSINVTNGGSGYSSVLLPSVQIEGGATATAIVGSGGAITGFRITNPGEGYAIAPAVSIFSNGFGKIIGGDATATELNRKHIKSAGGSLVAAAYYGIGDESKPLKTDVENMVAQTLGLAAGIHVLEKDGARLGLMDQINGMNTVDGDISLTAFGGEIGLGTPVQQTNAAGQLLWEDAAKTIPIYARDEQGRIIYQGGQLAAGTGTIKLTADDVSVNSYVSAGGGKLILQPVKAEASIGLNGTQATADAVITSGQVTGFTNLWGGRGYASEPIVTLTAPGQRAFAVASTLAGQVSSIKVTFGGTNYNAAHAPVVTLVGGGLNGATPAHPATATATYDADGQVTGITVTSAGSGYYTAPEVQISLPGTQAKARAVVTNGTVTGFTIVDPGSNYSVAPAVKIADPYPFSLNAQEIAYFQNGFDNVVVGRIDGRHTFHAAEADFHDGLTLRNPKAGAMQVEHLMVSDGPLAVVGSGNSFHLTSASPDVAANDVDIDDNVIVEDNTNGTITATTGYISIYGSGKGKIDGIAGSTTEDLTLTAPGNILVAGAIGSTAALRNLTINSTGGGTINLQQNVTLDGNLHIVKGSNITFGGNLQIGGNLVIDEGAVVAFNGTVTVGGQFTISKATSVSFAQTVSATGDLSIGDPNDPTKIGSITFGSTARLDAAAAVNLYSAGSIVFGNNVGQNLQPTAVNLRSNTGDVSFQGTVNVGSGSLSIIKARDVTFAQELLGGSLAILDASGQTRFARAATLGTMSVISTTLVQIANGLTLTGGDAVITSDQVAFDGGNGSVVYTGGGSSTLTIRPRTVSRAITVGSPPGVFTSLDLSDVDLAAIAPGFTEVVIGDSTAGTGAVTIGTIGSQQGAGNSQLFNSTSIYGGSVSLNQAVDSAAAGGFLRLIARTGNVTIAAKVNQTEEERNDVVEFRSLNGQVIVNQAVYAGNLIRIIASGAVTSGTNGFLVAPNLRVSSTGAVSLTNASNDLDVVAIDAGNNAIAFRNDGNFVIGTVDGVSGINSVAANTTLTSNGGTVTQTQPITSGGLLLQGFGGTWTLDSTSNNISTLAATTGQVTYRDADAVAVGTVASTNGMTDTGPVQVTAGTSLTVSKPVTVTNSGTLVLQALAGTVTVNTNSTLNAAGDTALTASGDVSSASTITSGGQVTLTSGTGAISSTAAISATGNATFSASTSVTSSAAVTSGAALSMTAGTSISSSGALQSTGATTLSAGTSVTSTSTITAGGTLSVTAGTTINSGGNIHATGNATITAPGAITSTAAIATDAALLITSNGADVTSGAAVSSGGNATISAAGNIASTSTITAGGTLGMSSGAAITSGGNIHSTGNATISAVGNVTSTAAIASDAVLSVTSSGAAISSGAAVSSGGNATINAHTSFGSTSTITTGGTLGITAGTTISSDGNIHATGDATLTAPGAITSTAGIASDGNLSITSSAAGITSGSAVSAGHNATISAGAAFASTSTITAGGTLDITAGTTIDSSGNIHSTGNATISAPGAITSTAGIASDAVLSVTSTGAGISSGGAISSGNNATLQAHTSFASTSTITTGGTLGITASTTISSDGAIDATGDATLTAAGNITSTAGIASDSNLSITSTGAAITSGGPIVAGHDATIDAHTSFDSTSTITVGGVLSVTAGSTVHSTGNIHSTGNATIAAPGAITSSAGIASDADLSITSTGASINSGGAIAAGHNATISAHTAFDSTSTIDAVGTLSVTAGSTLTSGGNIHAGGNATLSATANLTSTAAIDSGADLAITSGAAISSDGPISSTGNTTINANGAFDSGSTITTGGVLSITAGSTIQSDGAISATGNATLTAPGNVSSTAGISSGANLLIHSGAAVSSDGAIGSTGSTTIEAGTSFTSTVQSPITAGTTLSITAGTTITSAAAMSAGGNSTLTATGAISSTAGISSGANLLIHSGAAISSDGAIASTGSTTIEAGSSFDATANSPITAGTTLSITTGTTLTSAGTMSAGGNVTLTATGTVSTSAAITSGGVLAITTDNGFSSDGPLQSTGDTQIDAASFFQSNSTITAGGALSIDAYSITSHGDLDAVDNVTLHAADGLGITAGIASDHDISITTGGTAGFNGVISSGGNTTINAGGEFVSTNTITTGGTLGITAGGAINNSGEIHSTGNATLSAHNYVRSVAAITSDAALNFSSDDEVRSDAPITSAGDTTIDAGTTFVSTSTFDVGGVLSITSGSTFNSSGAIHADGNVTLTSGGTLTSTAAIDSGAVLNIHSDAGISSGGAISSTGNATIDADGAFSSTNMINAGGTLAVTAGGTLDSGGDIHATGTVNLDSADDLHSTAEISSDAAVVIHSGAEFRSDGAISSGTDTTITSADNFASNGTITVGGVLSVTSGGTLDSTGAIHSTGNATLSAAGTLHSTAAITSDAALQIDSAAAVISEAAIQSAGDTTVQAHTAFTSSSTITTGGILTISAGTTLAYSGAIDATGNASLTAGGNVTLTADTHSDGTLSISSDADISSDHAISTGSTLSIDADGDIALTGDITAGGNTTISAGDTLASGGAINVTGNATLTAGGDLSLTGPVTASGTLTVTATGHLTSDAAISAGGNLAMTGNTGFDSSTTLTAGGTLSVLTGGTFNSGGRIHAAGNVTLTSNGQFNSTAEISSDHSVLLTSHAALISSGPITAHDDLTLNLTGALDSTSTLTAGGTLIATVGGAISSDGAIHADGNVTLSAGGSFDSTAAISTGGSIVLHSGAAMTSGGAISAAHDAAISATGGITSNNTITAGGTLLLSSGATLSSSATVHSAGQLTLTAHDINATGAITSDVNIQMNAGGDLSSQAAVDAGTTLTVVAAGNATFTAPVTAGTTVSLAANGVLALSGDILAGGAVTLRGDDGIVAAADVTTSADPVTFSSAVVLAGDVTVDTGMGLPGGITFNGRIDGNHVLTLKTDGPVHLVGDVGRTTPLAALIVPGMNTFTADGSLAVGSFVRTSGTTVLNDGITTTSADGLTLGGDSITIGGDIRTINGPTVIDVGAGSVTITAAGGIDADKNVKITAETLSVANGGTIKARGGFDVVINSNQLTLGTRSNSVTGTGLLVLQPIDPTMPIHLGTNGPGFSLSEGEIAGLGSGFEKILIGQGLGQGFDSAGVGSHEIFVDNTVAFHAPVVVRAAAAGGSVIVNGSLTTDDGGIVVQSGGNLTVNGRVQTTGDGDVVLAADADGDEQGNLIVASLDNSRIKAVDGDIKLSGVDVLIGSRTAAAVVQTGGSISVDLTSVRGRVAITHPQTKLLAGGTIRIASSAIKAAQMDIEGTIDADGNVSIVTNGAADFTNFRTRSGGAINVTAGGGINCDTGTFIATGGRVILNPDADKDGNGQVNQIHVNFSQPSTLDLSAALASVKLPTVSRAGDRGSVYVNVTNTSTNKAQGYVSMLIYASSDTTIDATDRVIGKLGRVVRIKPGASKRLRVDVQIPDDLQAGSYHIAAELLPFKGAESQAVSAGNGGEDDDKRITFSDGIFPVATPDVAVAVTSSLLGGSLAAAGKGLAVVTLSNVGSVRGDGQADIAVYATTNGDITGATLVGKLSGVGVSLAPGKSKATKVAIKMPAGLIGGDYRLIAVATPKRGLADSNLDNNSATSGQTFRLAA